MNEGTNVYLVDREFVQRLHERVNMSIVGGVKPQLFLIKLALMRKVKGYPLDDSKPREKKILKDIEPFLQGDFFMELLNNNRGAYSDNLYAAELYFRSFYSAAKAQSGGV